MLYLVLFGSAGFKCVWMGLAGVWQCLTGFGNVWLGLALVGWVWQCLACVPGCLGVCVFVSVLCVL